MRIPVLLAAGLVVSAGSAVAQEAAKPAHFALGMGDTFDEKALKTLPAGSFSLMPAEMRHYATTKAGATVQVHGTGPFTLTYVNPADDPRQAAPAK